MKRCIRAQSGPRSGRLYPLASRVVLGRGGRADIQIIDPHLSREHAVIEYGHGRVVLTDQGSTNGTWIGGKQITTAELELGATFSVGATDFIVVDQELVAGAVEDGKLTGGPADEPTVPHTRVRAPAPGKAPSKGDATTAPQARTTGAAYEGAGAVLVAVLLLSAASWLVNAGAHQQVASLVCADGTSMEFRAEEYSYKPGQRGHEIGFECCDPSGKQCDDVTTTVVLGCLLLVSLVGIGLFVVRGATATRHPWVPRAILGGIVLAAVVVTGWLMLAAR